VTPEDTSPEALERYRAKRDFAATPEPAGDEQPPRAGAGGRFVVQEHHARRLHWDLRLERDGVLASWAVPKGIPPDPAVNHLAVHTEDHPLMYLDFEGEIPKGNYGAGTMSIWDRGTYECEKWDDREVMVVLHGARAKGRHVLFRTRGDDWMLHRMDPPEDPGRQPFPARLEPMLATPGSLPDDDSSYGFEVLWDGVRAVAYSEGGRARFEAEGEDDVTGRFPELRGLGAALGATQVVLDGEIIAPGDDGRPDPERLATRRTVAGSDASVRRAAERAPAAYMAYDVLYLDGRLTLELPYAERRRLLEGLGLEGPAWKAPTSHVGDGAALLELGRSQGLAGVVAKRLESPYRPGSRSPDWVEVRS
jgi:bifunctional non-homologous end joining protein LigD